MEESLSIMVETLESLDPLNNPLSKFHDSTMKRRNPYLIKFPPLRLIRDISTQYISRGVHQEM